MNEEVLKDKLKEFEGNNKVKVFNELKQLVEETFKKYGKDGDDMIALDFGNFEDHYAAVQPAYEEWCWKISWDVQPEYSFVEHIYKPIGWDECDSEKWDDDKADELTEKYERMLNVSKKIKKLLEKLVKTTDLEKVGDMDSTNEIWYAVTAITRDLKFVSFVIRDDGLPLEDDGSFYHEEDLNKIVA